MNTEIKKNVPDGPFILRATVVVIDRNRWSPSVGTGGRHPSERVVVIVGMLEGSNRSRVTGAATGLRGTYLKPD